MLIGGLQKLTLIDYPGKICVTVFTIGCNFSCPFCYNPELVDPKKIKKQPIISEEDFFNFLENRRGILEGVCITGGEPTIHKDLHDFLSKIKSLGFAVKLDTNGSNPEMLKKLIDDNLLDYIAMDIKNAKIKNQTCPTARRVSKSVELIKNSGVDYEFRTTVVPALHTQENIIQIAKDLSPAKRFFLQQFQPGKNLDSSFAKEKPYPLEKLVEFCQIIRPYFDYCGIRE